MSSKCRLLIEGATTGIYDVKISDDRTGLSPIAANLSTLNASYEIKRIYIEKIDSSISTAYIDFAGASGKWLVAPDISGVAGSFAVAITISSLPAYFWVRIASSGITEASGEDTFTVLRVTTTQTDLFDTMRNLRATGVAIFDTLRLTAMKDIQINCDTERVMCTYESLMVDTIRILCLKSQSQFNGLRSLLEINKFDADTVRRLRIPKKNYYFIL